MARHYIKKRETLAGYLAYSFIFFFVGFLILSSMAAPNQAASSSSETFTFVAGSILLIATVLPAIFMYWYRRNLLKQRKVSISQLAQTNGWDQVAASATHRENIIGFGSTSMTALSEDKVDNESNCLYTADWAYCDYSYAVYRHSKNGRYKVADVYYAAMATTLPRKLPNIVFDSLKSRRRQFRMLFSRSQRHSLEGDFDNYFATYFPEDYSIDSLSFISPDVMQVLKDAADYDFEILDDKLYMFGAMYDPNEQISDMSTKLMKIKKELLDNILTYRDERLAFAEGRKTVANEGLRLKRSHLRAILTVIGFVAYLIIRVIIEERSQ